MQRGINWHPPNAKQQVLSELVLDSVIRLDQEQLHIPDYEIVFGLPFSIWISLLRLYHERRVCQQDDRKGTIND